MKKVLLLNPPYEGGKFVRVERCMQPASAWSALWPPLPLMYGQAVLDKNNIRTKLVDAVAKGLTIYETCKKIEDFTPDIMVINTAMQTFSSDSKVLFYVKKNLPNCINIATGVIGILYPEFLRKTNYFDYIIVSEIERALLEICKNGKKTKITKFVKRSDFSLDSLPFPSLYDLNLDKYQMPFTKERFTLVNPSRGCPNKCIYCIVPLIYDKIKYRNSKNFVDELERDVKVYNIKNFLFWTETFTQNLNFAKSICKEIIKRKLKIKWMTTTRVDYVNLEILKLMKKSGCFMLSFGIESLSQNVLDLCNKNVKIENVEKSIELTKEAGLDSMAHIIIGLPGMKKTDVIETVDWLIKNDVTYAQFYCVTPYPKTKLAKMAQKEKWLSTVDPSVLTMNKAPMRNEYLSAKEIEDMRKWAYRKFYLRPSFIFREMKKYPIRNLISSGLYFIRGWVSI